jgi:hypothetical protein
MSVLYQSFLRTLNTITFNFNNSKTSVNVSNASRMAIITKVYKLATKLNYLYGEYSSVSNMVRWPKYIQYRATDQKVTQFTGT